MRRGGALVRSGGDLLSRDFSRSTISGGALNGRVRDGIGCIAQPMATRPDQDPPGGGSGAGAGARAGPGVLPCISLSVSCVLYTVWQGGVRLAGMCMLPVRGDVGLGALSVTGSDQAYRTISTGRLSALLRVHLRPIDVVVCHGPQGRPGFEGGFPLRCLQRLSCPFMATRHCRWHDNRSTSGTFTPVLSY